MTSAAQSTSTSNPNAVPVPYLWREGSIVYARVSCFTCGGEGLVLNRYDEDEACSDCGGRGYLEMPTDQEPRFSRLWAYTKNSMRADRRADAEMWLEAIEEERDAAVRAEYELAPFACVKVERCGQRYNTPGAKGTCLACGSPIVRRQERAA